MKKALFISIVLFCLSPQAAPAGDDLVWEKITDKDWQVAPDSAKGIRNAVVLFEKIVADDRDLLNNKFYVTIYRRIKIFNAEGRQWGDFSLPYLNKKQKIEFIRGRTVLPDGQEFPLLETQIFEKEIFKAKGLKIKQKSFSLPGVADGCIVEYALKYRLPSSYGAWIFQKEIPVIYGEYRWLFYRGQGLSGFYSLFNSVLTPNYLWLNTTSKYLAEQRPSLKDPTEVFFAVNNVPAFEAEPQALPEVALQAQLRCYYSSGAAPAAFWGELTQNISLVFEQYTKNNKRGREVVASFSGLKTEEEKIVAAYNWLQSHIKNIDYLDSDQALKPNASVDETLKRGYGTQEDINYVFYDMLREMNIDAKMVFAADRDENLFVEDAKYWQFDRSLVAVPGDGGKYSFYSPGDLYLPAKCVPWFNEGTQALLVGHLTQQFTTVPFAPAELNRTRRHFTLQLQDESKLRGKLIEQRFGHSGRALRVLLAQTAKTAHHEKLREELAGIMPKAEIDSLAATGAEECAGPVTLNCSLQISMSAQRLGTRLLLRPFALFKPDTNAFHADTRRTAIMFDYAQELVELMHFDLPENWEMEALPSDTTFTNKAGKCHVSFQRVGKKLSVQKMFRLNRPFWPASDYAMVKELFQTQQAMEALAVVLKKP